MSVARVTILDYMSAEPADEIDLAYWEIFPQTLREADALILVLTIANSYLSIPIYRTEELAEEMLLKRAKMLEQCPFSIRDMFHFERPVGLHYVNELLLETKAT